MGRSRAIGAVAASGRRQIFFLRLPASTRSAIPALQFACEVPMAESSNSPVNLIATRLATFSALLDKVEGQWAGRDLDELANVRLAADMHPLYWQIAAVAQQALGFAAWCKGGTLANSVPEVSGWVDARKRLADACAELAAVPASMALPDRKRIDIEMVGMYLDISGQRYVDDWLLPNLYFHCNTAYAILRSQGAEIGKADVLAHLLGELKPMESAG